MSTTEYNPAEVENIIQESWKKNNSYKIFPKMEIMFRKFKESGVKILAYPKSKLIMTYNHECVSNLLNAAGVKSN